MFDATILIDNIASGELISEWGFAAYIEYNGKNYLLDTGGSDKYLQNANKLGINIEDVDVAVLSHAHYDHSSGFESFYKNNSKAKLLVSEYCCDDCYFKLGPIRKYVGITKTLSEHTRTTRVAGFQKIDDGVYIVPHLKNNLEKIGKKAHMYRRIDGKVVPDDFAHEQSLVYETSKGLVVLNSCSHAGLHNILNDVAHYLPGKNVYMTIGGMHLAASSKKDVVEIANKISGLQIERVITGHCTGKRAYNILHNELGDMVELMHVGMRLKVD